MGYKHGEWIGGSDVGQRVCLPHKRPTIGSSDRCDVCVNEINEGKRTFGGILLTDGGDPSDTVQTVKGRSRGTVIKSSAVTTGGETGFQDTIFNPGKSGQPVGSGAGFRMEHYVNRKDVRDGVKLPDRSGCHHTGVKPFRTLANGKTLYGAAGGKLMAHGADVDHLDLIIDCAGLVTRKPFVKSGGVRFRGLDTLTFPEVMRLDWPDATAPVRVRLRFWSRLRDIMPQNVCVACFGSHGRTGTALAALLIADGMTAEEAIETVRKDHCQRAIETKAQEDYLKSLAGEYVRPVNPSE